MWAHVLLILSFLAYLPYSKHLHIITAVINVFFGRTRARGRLEPLVFDDPDVPEDEIRLGSGTLTDMTWKQMVDTATCTECGRCQDVCPAYATGKELSPKLLIMGLRDHLLDQGPKLLSGCRTEPTRSRWCQTRSPTTSSGTASRAAPACTSARSRSSTSTTSSTCAATW